MKKVILIGSLFLLILLLVLAGYVLIRFIPLNNQPSTVSEIEVISPKGGEVFVAGNTYTIKWSGATSKEAKEGTVSILYTWRHTGDIYSNDMGEIAILDIEDIKSGSYEWTIPSHAYIGRETDKFLIHIRYSGDEESGFIEGVSEDYFSIVENTTPCIGDDGKEYPKYYSCVDPQTCSSKPYCDPAPGVACGIKSCENGEWEINDEACLIEREDNIWQLTISGVTYPECS